MLTPEYLQEVTKELEEYFYDLETEILKDIAERLRLNDNAMTSTAAYQLSQLKVLGASNEKVNSYLSRALKISKKKANEIISSSVYASIENDNVIFKEAYDKGLIASFSYDRENFKNLIIEGVSATSNDLTNICSTTLRTSQEKLTSALNNVYLQVSSGAFTMDQAVDNVVTQLSKEGLGVVEYKSGVRRQLDTAVRTAVRSSINKTACKAQEQNLDDFECNLVEVTSHLGARPEHALWQGKIYWRLYKYKNYSNFVEATHYGSGEGLGGWNCRHSFYPFFEGISEKTFEHYKSKENNELYELQQEQRYNERKIREWKRRRDVKRTAGLDTSKESQKLKYWNSRNDRLIKSDARLKHNYGREKVYLPKKNGIIDISDIKISGALDPNSKKASKHAEQYYESIRKMKTDYKKIALNTGYSEELIKKIKYYSFVEEHDLITGKERFYPDYHMAQSWQRLIEGKNIQKHDLLLLEHEMYELILVDDGISQLEAHNFTNKIYNYKEGCEEYDGIFKKFYKKR
nr:MAG TPA: minor capsid protein [Caudoviricetes sp.]